MIDDKWIDVNGLGTRYREAEQGEQVVVLIHGGLFSQSGLCLSSAVWDAALIHLARDLHVYALDTLGQGRNDLPRGEGGYTIAAMIEHVRGFIRAIGAKKPHLVGHDEGAMLAMRLALKEPDRIASCSIVDSAAVAPAGDGVPNTTLLNPPQPLYSAASQRWLLDQCLYGRESALSGNLIDEAVAIAATSGFHGVRAQMTAGDYYQRFILVELAELRFDNFARWRDQDCPTPTQLIWGWQDRVSLAPYAEALHGIIAARTKVAQLHYINRAGYLPFMEEPRVFAELVRGFVRATSCK